MDWRNQNPSAVAFIRVSSHRQRDNTSHETQEQEIALYCAEHGLELVKTVRMVESAKDSQKRTQYRHGLQWALKHKVRHVLFYIFDRETRNLTDNERNENLVRSGQIVLHYVKEGRVYHAGSSDSDFFLRDVQAVTNKQFIRQLRTKVIDAMRTKAESGWYPGNQPPLGYVHEKMRDAEGRELKRGTVIAVDPIERNVRQVQREFELRAAGHSAEQIRNIIIREGFISAGDIRKYHRSAIEHRLRNPFYSGEFEWQGERYKGKHPLIIPPRILDQVARSLGRGAGYQRRSGGEFGIFGGGWMTCAEPACGCNIVYDPKTKPRKDQPPKVFHYYHCTNGRRVHVTMRGMTIQEDQIWEQFAAAVDSISITERLAKEVADALNETHAKVRAARKREIFNYREGLNALEREEDLAYQDMRRGILDEGMYRRQIERIRGERRNFTDLLEGANSALDGAYLETAQSILELAKDAKSLWFSREPQERLEFLKLILSNPKLEGLNVRYELKKPFGTLSKMKVCEDWRLLVDAFRTDVQRIAA